GVHSSTPADRRLTEEALCYGDTLGMSAISGGEGRQGSEEMGAKLGKLSRRSDELDRAAADSGGPGTLSRAAYARKVYAAAKTGYLAKKS
ncbi:unnamed protein product, partial [Scytosiphon promiscuus]